MSSWGAGLRYAVVGLFLALADVQPALGNVDAKRLYDDLLNGYNSLIRPVSNNSDRLTVRMGLKLSQLIDVVSSLFSFDFLLVRFRSLSCIGIAINPFKKNGDRRSPSSFSKTS